MFKYAELLGIFFGKLTRSLKSQIISDVPLEDALCEFDCRKEQCQYDEWSHCPNRLSYLASEAGLTGSSSTNEIVVQLKYGSGGRRPANETGYCKDISVAQLQEGQSRPK